MFGFALMLIPKKKKNLFTFTLQDSKPTTIGPSIIEPT